MLAEIALAAVLHSTPTGNYIPRGIGYNLASACPDGDTTIQDPNGVITCQGPVFVQSSPTVIYQSSPGIVYGNVFGGYPGRGGWGGGWHHHPTKP